MTENNVSPEVAAAEPAAPTTYRTVDNNIRHLECLAVEAEDSRLDSDLWRKGLPSALREIANDLKARGLAAVRRARPRASLSADEIYELIKRKCVRFRVDPLDEMLQRDQDGGNLIDIFDFMTHLRAALRVDPKAETPESDRHKAALREEARQEMAAERHGVAPPPDMDEDRLVALALDYHKRTDGEGEGEYGCNGITCPGVQKLVRLLRRAYGAADLPMDVDTLRRLRDRVDAALDAKYKTSASREADQG